MTFDPLLQQLLEAWMPRQRWYPAKGRGVGVRHQGVLHLTDPTADVVVEAHLVGLDSGDRLDVVQVPVTYRSAPLAGADHALIGTADLAGLGPRWVYDGPHDPVYVTALLAALDRPDGHGGQLTMTATRVLRGEQSNTSIIIDLADADPVIVKVFRAVHPGANPDVEVLRALADNPQVPALAGWLGGTWRGSDGVAVSGHLAVAAEFVIDGRDAWREAADSVAAGSDFAEPARSLGAATATLHLALAQAFGTATADDEARHGLLDAVRGRVAWALRTTDALSRHRPALARWADQLDLGDLPPMQRIHGDYHLGQVLHSPQRGWVILDFEGEPLRPLSERTRPDLALRDVAGMLRSFDYAAGQVRVGTADPGVRRAADAWASSARDAFCSGYAEVAGDDPREQVALLAALELDKALYEVVYEAGNRPDWIDVPLGAVDRLVRSGEDNPR